MRPALEIAVQDATGARVALDAGADRVELCQALASTGGLTPSTATIDAVLAAAGDRHRVAVLVRPRPGGFVYDEDEVAIVSADISHALQRGAGAVVVGALTPEGGVDRRALDAWRTAAGDADVVFHRAIDTVPDPSALIDDLVECGVQRVLTSGGAARSIDGLENLAGIVAAASRRLQVMAGGGVRPEDIVALLDRGVDAVHLSARKPSGDGYPSGPGGGGPGYDVTDEVVVSAASAALRGR